MLQPASVLFSACFSSESCTSLMRFTIMIVPDIDCESHWKWWNSSEKVSIWKIEGIVKIAKYYRHHSAAVDGKEILCNPTIIN